MQFVTPTTPLSLRMVCSAFSRSKEVMTSPESVTWPLTAATWTELNRIFQRRRLRARLSSSLSEGATLKTSSMASPRRALSREKCREGALPAPASHYSASGGTTDENDVAACTIIVPQPVSYDLCQFLEKYLAQGAVLDRFFVFCAFKDNSSKTD